MAQGFTDQCWREDIIMLLQHINNFGVPVPVLTTFKAMLSSYPERKSKIPVDPAGFA
jgi:hypothetical protein